MAKYDIVQLEQQYNGLRSALIQLDQEVDHQLAQLLRRNVPLAFPVQHRVKTWSSIEEKLQRVPLSLTSLRDMQDLVGQRHIFASTSGFKTLISRPIGRCAEDTWM
jgi:ppGpp synthetase/RelA/SpoT-type nucleotidyltranferase